MRSNHLMGALAVAAVLCAVPAPLSAQSGNTPAVYTLPEIDLAAFIASTTGVTADGHGVKLGGIGSDLWRGPGDEPGVYWMMTDRGPNADALPSGKTFPVYQFTPTILKVRARDGVIEILQALPITGVNDAASGVSGLPNLLNLTEAPAPNEPIYACDLGPLPVNAVTGNPTNPNGIDAEGLVRLRDGSFWVAEEYGPSLLKIDPNGRVVKRYFPSDLLDYFPLGTPTGYAADDSTRSFPKVFGLKRKLNRGFEGLAVSPNEKTLYIALQSPLNNPTSSAGNNARNTRILAFDIGREQVVAEYVYRFQPAGEFANVEFDSQTNGNRARDMKVSALVMLDQRRMLVLERTDFVAKVYLVDLKTATNILGSKWDDVATFPTLEALVSDSDVVNEGIVALPKTLVATFDASQGAPQKIEGLTVLNGNTLVIANDNDFGVGTFTGSGAACALTTDNGFTSQIRVIALPVSIK